jgi:hypothetical protein
VDEERWEIHPEDDAGTTSWSGTQRWIVLGLALATVVALILGAVWVSGTAEDRYEDRPRID